MTRSALLLALALAACSCASDDPSAPSSPSRAGKPGHSDLPPDPRTDPLAVLGDRKAFLDDRAEAIAALRSAGRGADAARLIGSRLEEAKEDERERWRCLVLAQHLGKDGAPLVPALLRILRTTPDSVTDNTAITAARALAAIAPDDPEAFAAVDAARPKELDFLGSFWAEPLSGFGERALPTFVAWIRAEDTASRMMAARSMGKCGPGAVPYLVAALRDKEHWIALAAAESLRTTGAPAKDVVPAIAEMLDGQETRAASALDALAKFGPDAASVAPRVRPFLASGEPYVHLAATNALFHLTGEVSDDDVARVGEALTSRYVPVHNRAAHVLRDLGPRARPALSRFAKAMHRVTRETRATLCAAIGAMGPSAKPEGVAILRSLLRGDPDPEPQDPRDLLPDCVVRYDDLDAAIAACVSLEAREAVPEIRRILTLWESSDESDGLVRLRRHARAALAKLES